MVGRLQMSSDSRLLIIVNLYSMTLSYITDILWGEISLKSRQQ